MGTKVQSKGYLPGYYAMRDINEDSTSCSWPLFYEDKTLSNGHYYNGFFPRTASDAYDKDVLKQKMLEHEAVFRNQVSELHRVYRIQRDLMEEIKIKELHDNKIPTESSLSSSPLGYQTPEGVHKWQSPGFPLPNTFDGRSSISGASASASPFSSVREKNAKTSSFGFQNEGSSKISDVLESRPSKVRRKLLDLELPPDEYIDTEDGEHAKEEDVLGTCTSLNNRNCGNLDCGARIFLNRSGNAGSQVGAPRLPRKNGLTDLNEPAQMERTNSAVVSSLGRVSCHEEFLHMELKSQFAGLPNEAVLHSHHVNGMPNNSQSKSQGNDKGSLSCVLQAGYNNDKINRDFCRDRRDPGLEAPERGHKSPSTVGLNSFMASQIPSPYTGGVSSNLLHPWLHGVSSWETQSNSLSQKNATTRMLPCFNSSSFSMISQPSKQSHGSFTNGLHVNRSNLNFGSDLLKQNGFSLGSSSGSKELPVHVSSRGYVYPSCSIDINATSGHLPNASYAKGYNGLHVMDPRFAHDLNLNAAPPNNLSNEQFSGKALEVLDVESKNDGILPWLRPKSACSKEESNVGRDFKLGNLSFLNSSSQSVAENESKKVSTSHYTLNVKSSLHSSKKETKRTEISKCPKILGVPIFRKPCSLKSESKSVPPPSASSLSSEREVLKNRKVNILLDINMPCDSDPDCDLGKQRTTETRSIDKCKDTISVDIRHQIDLNSFANEDEVCLLPHGSPITEKIAVDIDLEAPFIHESEDEYGATHIEGPKTLPKATEQRVNSSLEEVVKLAAEAIVSISSSDPQSNLQYITDKPSEASTQDSLGWFAEIVSSCAKTINSNPDNGSRGKSDDGNENTSRDEIDDFELMTLNLTECREEDYIPKPLVPESIQVEETCTSLLTNRPRRGQSRRGKQRKDFQRDILPGLISLSRNEVTEDLQTFGGLMRATGHSWNSRLGRRTPFRNGGGRGRRRSLVSSPPTVATKDAGTPLIQQFNNIEVGLGLLDDRNLRGWGKTTRRPRRRQRCPAGNMSTHPVT